MISTLSLPFEQHVGLTDRVSLGINSLPIEHASDFLFVLCGEHCKSLFRDREHTASSACAVVKQVSAGLNLVLNWEKNEIGHQTYGVARRPVLARLLVILLIEFADKFLEHCAHRMVVDAGRREVDIGIKKLVDQRPDSVGFGKRGKLVAELEIVEEVLNVAGESIQVVLKISKKLLLAAARFQIAQREL